jgi:signal transduction histidine kinase
MSTEGRELPKSSFHSKRSFFRSSIVWKLTLFVGVLVTLNCGVLIGVAYVATSVILREQIDERLSTVASDRQEMLAYMLERQEERAAQLAKQVRIHRLLAQRAEGTLSPDRFRVETEAILANARASTTGFLAFWIEDEAGQVLASDGPNDLVAGYSRLRRSEERPDGGLIVPPRRVGSSFGFVFSSVVRGSGGRALGAVLLLSDFGPVATFLMDPNGLEETGEVLVGVAEGETIRLILPSRRLSPVSEIAASQFPVMSDAIAGKFGCKQTIDYQGKDVVAAYRPVGFGFTGWGLIAKIDSAEAYRPVALLRWLLLALGGAALVLGLGASNAIARRFARPIHQLAKTASAVASGDLNVRGEVTGSDEIGALSKAFNRMTEDLARSYGTLERRISERTSEIRRLNESQVQHANELARSEAALLEQTRILQSVLDCMGDGVVVADSNARFLVFNPAAQRMLGQGRIDSSPNEWSRRYEIFLPDRVTPYPVEDLPLMRAIRGLATDQAELYIAYPSRDDGTYILVTGRPLYDENDDLRGGVIVFHDSTRRKKTERRLAAQYETTRVLAEADTPAQANAKILETICNRLDWDYAAFWRVDAHAQRLRCATLWHRQTSSAPQFEALTRKLDYQRGVGLPGRVWADAQPAWIPEIARDANSPRRAAAEEDGLRSAFAVPIVLRGDCLGVLEFFSHESRPPDHAMLEMVSSLSTQIGQFIERHQMRARVIQSEKLASLGMLSAGVAHEINNPLAYVSNNLAVLERDIRFLLMLLAIYEKADASLAATEPELVRQASRLASEFDLAYVKDNIGTILRSTRQGVKRVADIVQNLRGFARLDQAVVDQADIHEALKTAVEMLRGRLDRRHIAIEEHLGDLPLVAGSAAQLNQVFLNLLVNAMQAIESTDRADGLIAITTLANEGEIVVEVADNGCGIPEAVLPQIFDPFFTTKDVGDGTGLGLSITHSMVQDHGGRLEVESVLGVGTRFRVFLPVARSRAAN